MVQKARKQGLEAADHTALAVRKQKETNVGAQLVFSLAQGMGPPTFRVYLPNSINLIKRIPLRYP